MNKMQKCSICKEDKEKNISLFGKSICAECEKKIVQCQVDDEDYKSYMKAIKEILYISEKA